MTIPSPQTFTFLYTDVESSTRLWEQHRQAAQVNLARQDQILREAVQANNGEIFRTVGDGICAVFRNASNAVAAAFAAQSALQAESWKEIDALWVRIAIHTGEAEANHGDYSGSSLNRMGRLLGVTHGGQVLLSQATQLLVRDSLPQGADLLDLGEIHMRDLSSPEHVFQLRHPNLFADFPPLASLGHYPSNLPASSTPLIGREVELAEVVSALRGDLVRLLTLTGPGGTGKTRLSLQAAGDLTEWFEDGTFFVDLAPIRDPGAVLSAIARTLALRESGDRPILDEIVGFLKAKRMLLLLDNFEQVTSAAIHVVELLHGCPQLKLLVTSREALRVRGERIFPVPPLQMPAADLLNGPVEELAQVGAVRLFVERAQAVKPGFQLTRENAPAVVEICSRLDGLPLAIELATARLNLFSPQALLERLGTRLKVLRGGARDLPTRQQTLQDTVDWSYQLLDRGEQDLFALFSVFVGGSFDAVEEVAGQIERLTGTGTGIMDETVSLLAKSLIRQVELENGESRLGMLETIREFAAARLGEDPSFKADARKAHAVYFSRFVQQQGERLTGDDREAALITLGTDIENVRVAWSYWVQQKDLEQLGKLIDSLWQFYDVSGWYHALLDITTDLLDLLSTRQPTTGLAEEEIILQTSLGRLLLAVKGYTPEVERAYSRALELSEMVGDISRLFPVLRGLASYYVLVGEFAKSMRLGEQMLSLAEKHNDMSMRVEGHLVMGSSLAFLDKLSLGLDHLERGIAAYDPDTNRARRFRLGSNPGVSCTTTSALVLWMLGYPDRAVNRANESVDLARRLNHPSSITYALFHNGLLHYWLNEGELAYGCAQLVLKIAKEHGFQLWNAIGLCLTGAGLARMGKPEEGLVMIQRGMEIYQGLKTPPVFWPNLLIIQAEVNGWVGKPAEGLRLVDEALRITGGGTIGALPAEYSRLKGELLFTLYPQDPKQAEFWIERALQVAQTSQSRMIELRAAISLYRLWEKQGKAEPARQILSQVYQKFQEGFDRADLIEARAVLEAV